MRTFKFGLVILSNCFTKIHGAQLPAIRNVESPPLPAVADEKPRPNNASFIEEIANDLVLESYPQTFLPAPKQWFIPDLFKRQSTCVGGKCANLGNNCPCGFNCCTSSTYGYCCAEPQLCDPAFFKPGPTQLGAGCLVTSAVLYTLVITTGRTGSTTTVTSTLSQATAQVNVVTFVSVVTASSIATATIIDTVTATSGAARRARDLRSNVPAKGPKQPQETAAGHQVVTSPKYQTPSVPLVTAGSTSPNEHFELMRKAKRQALSPARTSTTTTGTTTQYVTAVVTFTVVVTNRATSVVASTLTQVSTTFINARATTRITTTIYTAAVRSAGSQTTAGSQSTSSAGGTTGNSGANNEGTISPTQGGGGLSTGAKAGIGVGAGLGALLLGLLIFFLLRRSKQRKAGEQARIDAAVNQAIDDHQQQQQRASAITNEKISVGTMSSVSSPGPYHSSPAQAGYPQPYGHPGPGYTPELGATPVMRNSVPMDYTGQHTMGHQGGQYGGYAPNTPEMYAPPPQTRHEM